MKSHASNHSTARKNDNIPCGAFSCVCGVQFRSGCSYQDRVGRLGELLREKTNFRRYHKGFSTTGTLSASASTASTVPRKVKPSASEPSKLRQSWSLGKKSRSTRSARTSPGARLPTYSYPMARTSLTHWSKAARLVGSDVGAGKDHTHRVRAEDLPETDPKKTGLPLTC